MMIKVGLVGEDPNDTSSIRNLLLKKYRGIQFRPLVKGIKGYQLNNPKIKRALPIEFESQKCSFVIYIKDLDGFKSEKSKLNACLTWFNELDSSINKEGLLLLNIWELEGLIFSDMETFNILYKTKHKFKGDSMFIKEPKEELQRITRDSKKQYKESHCPDIFNHLDFNIVAKNCASFREFVSELDKKLK